MAGYNLTREVEELLAKTETSPPSFTLNLHVEHWTLNNGSKFLYNNPVASLLEDVRAHRIPVDFLEIFDSARVPFYEGRMIVELLDYRPARAKEPPLEKPVRTRVVLHPTAEAVWADICLMNQRTGYKFTDTEALQFEAKFLMATAPPLCLEPDPHLTRIANSVLRVSTPSAPPSLKRKAVALDAEEDETDKVRRAKIMQFMNPQLNRSHTPSYHILEALQRVRERAQGRPPSTAPHPNGQVHPSMGQPPAAHPSMGPSPAPPQTILQNGGPAQNGAAVQNGPNVASGEGPSKPKPKPVKKKPDNIQPAYNPPGGASQPISQYQLNNHRVPTPVSSAQSPQLQFVQSQQVPSQQSPRSSTPAPPPPQPPPQAQAHVPAQQQMSPPNRPLSAFQPQVPGAQFLHQPPNGSRTGQPKPNGNAAPPVVMAQPQNMAQMQMYMQAQRAQAAAQQSQNGGRSTPAQGQVPVQRGSPMPANAAQAAAQRGSPMLANQQQRSPAMAQAQAHPPQMANGAAAPAVNGASPIQMQQMYQMIHAAHSKGSTVPLHVINQVQERMRASGQPIPPPIAKQLAAMAAASNAQAQAQAQAQGQANVNGQASADQQQPQPHPQQQLHPPLPQHPPQRRSPPQHPPPPPQSPQLLSRQSPHPQQPQHPQQQPQHPPQQQHPQMQQQPLPQQQPHQQQQAQMMATQFPMYGYQMNYPVANGRMAAGYPAWAMGMGRGQPVPVQHAQQMAGKVPPGQMQR